MIAGAVRAWIGAMRRRMAPRTAATTPPVVPGPPVPGADDLAKLRGLPVDPGEASCAAVLPSGRREPAPITVWAALGDAGRVVAWMPVAGSWDRIDALVAAARHRHAATVDAILAAGPPWSRETLAAAMDAAVVSAMDGDRTTAMAIADRLIAIGAPAPDHRHLLAAMERRDTMLAADLVRRGTRVDHRILAAVVRAIGTTRGPDAAWQEVVALVVAARGAIDLPHGILFQAVVAGDRAAVGALVDAGVDPHQFLPPGSVDPAIVDRVVAARDPAHPMHGEARPADPSLLRPDTRLALALGRIAAGRDDALPDDIVADLRADPDLAPRVLARAGVTPDGAPHAMRLFAAVAAATDGS